MDNLKDLIVKKIVAVNRYMIETNEEPVSICEYVPANEPRYYSMAVPVPTSAGLRMGEIKIENATTIEEAAANINTTFRKHIKAVEEALSKPRLALPGDANAPKKLVLE